MFEGIAPVYGNVENVFATTLRQNLGLLTRGGITPGDFRQRGQRTADKLRLFAI